MAIARHGWDRESLLELIDDQYRQFPPDARRRIDHIPGWRDGMAEAIIRSPMYRLGRPGFNRMAAIVRVTIRRAGRETPWLNCLRLLIRLS